jgi:hypothetical protein
VDKDINTDDEHDATSSLANSGDQYWFSDDEDDSQHPQAIITVKQDTLFDPDKLTECSEDVSNEVDDLPVLQSKSVLI